MPPFALASTSTPILGNHAKLIVYIEGSAGIPQKSCIMDSDFLFLIQATLPLARTDSEQMTTMAGLHGACPGDEQALGPSDLHLP